ncbi:MAG: ATP-binding cassette domain-containing protein, partial [Spirochaetota bacterium]|nr:ATP-binding cassette domain-containing protein [Spirochaetota bacterium]
MSEPILSVKNLKIHFPIKKGFLKKKTRYVKAVDDVSFSIFPGESIGLVGESGSGKTTIGRGILQLIPNIMGEVFFMGKNLLTLGRKELKPIRRDLQIIFQDPFSSLNPRMTIGNIIEEGLDIHKIGVRNKRREMVLDLLETVGIDKDYYDRYPHEFSGGQRQRIGIARALILKPKLVICDEPVSALDVSIQVQVL